MSAGTLAAVVAATAVLLLSPSRGGSALAHGTEEGMPYPPAGKPKPDTILHVPTGLPVSFEGAMEMISGARLVCIGETHDNIHAHRVELSVIRELSRRYPGRVAIGMEMFREPRQAVLDRWTRGELSELEFLKEVRWHASWGSDFGYYRDILAYAKENRIDVIALNPARELQEEVRRAGPDNVTGNFRRKLPGIGPPDPYQREAMKAVYEGHVRSEGEFDSFFRVQMLWEETMAQRIVDYLGSPRGMGKKMVTITGGWHVRYGFGIPKKVIRRMPMPYVIVLPEEIEIPEGMKDRIMDVEVPEIPLLPSDFIWYVPYEDLEGKRVRMGVLLSEENGRVTVRSVDEGSPAAKAGVRPGDVIVSFDGHPVEETADILYLMERKREGDAASLALLRGGESARAEITLFRIPERKPH